MTLLTESSRPHAIDLDELDKIRVGTELETNRGSQASTIGKNKRSISIGQSNARDLICTRVT